MADFGEVWPPGFRFHPTDEELVLYYLKRKICRRKLKLDIIGEVDVYKCDPEELPGLSLLKNGDRLWFFFSPRDRKYPNGSRSNRATRYGYWKATGKDRTISCSNRTVGLKKTLVFYKGRAPSGERTDWVMHEYVLEESELSRCQNIQDYFALYKLFKKSGPGPKNGEQYGAPFKEEDWVDDELPEVSNYNDTEKHGKQLNGIASIDMHKDMPKVQCTWDDIEEFMKQFVDEPVPVGPDINYYECALPQVFGEKEAQSTMTGPSTGKAPTTDLCKIHPSYGQENVEGSMNFRSPTSQLQLHDVNNLEQHVIEEDFLELDDLLGSGVTSNFGEDMPQPVGGDPANNSQWGDVDGLSELDLYYDAEMFLNEMIPVNQPTYPHSYPDLQASLLVNSDVQEGKLKNQATGDLCGDNFTPNAMESKSNENRSGKGVEGDDNWYTSALWSFVESIPTTPASAADSALVNRAFGRMSSFTRLRLNPKTVTAAVAAEAASNGSTGGRMKGFFHFSFMGALFALLFVLIGVFGKIMLSTEFVK